ncbi:hypothetical protein RF11_00183 [Thelohanellus kitauei]|uniref:CCHC-type domain-containing protein n=1 Tax=Thelohanellus kitauei TaxID=669202 RepID=A0A0C2JLZ3_THEKT|nr:hypothetical protein RF11_00183 [Thelohanellus kitauei]
MDKDATFEILEQFNTENGSLTEYMQRFRLWAALNDIPPEKQTAFLFCVIGSDACSTLWLVAGKDEIGDMSIDEIEKRGSTYFCHPGMTIVSRFRFRRCVQGPNESIREYSLKLLKASERCNFEEFKDSALLDAFILGVNDPKGKIKDALFMREELTFKEAVNIATIIMEVEKANEMKKTAEAAQLVSGQIANQTKNGTCKTCGSVDHTRNKCPHINARCTFCNRNGHTQNVCRSKN